MIKRHKLMVLKNTDEEEKPKKKGSIRDTTKIIGIIGSRRRNRGTDFTLLFTKFFEIYKEGDIICSGGCPTGGDNFAKSIWRTYHIPYLEFPADWVKNGFQAGFIRNTPIALWSDILIALVAEDRTGGTEDTIKKYLAAGKKDLILL